MKKDLRDCFYNKSKIKLGARVIYVKDLAGACSLLSPKNKYTLIHSLTYNPHACGSDYKPQTKKKSKGAVEPEIESIELRFKWIILLS